MTRNYFFPIFAILGLCIALFVVYQSNKHPPIAPIPFPPPTPPYAHYVAASGIIEAASENILIGTSFNELIEKIYVTVGSQVKKGDPLFKVDTRSFEAALEEATQAAKSAEDSFESAKVQFAFYQNLQDSSAVSQSDYQQSYFNYLVAKDQWEVALAKVVRSKTDIEKATVVAPMDGTVLQIASHVGEVANINPFNQKALMVFGNLNQYHLRVDIDEEDSWRIQKGKSATAYVRGNSSIRIPLEFLYIEPYVIPKQSLSGSNQERVDTRVLQVIFRFSKDHYPVYVGQLLDVFVEALPEDKRFDE